VFDAVSSFSPLIGVDSDVTAVAFSLEQPGFKGWAESPALSVGDFVVASTAWIFSTFVFFNLIVHNSFCTAGSGFCRRLKSASGAVVDTKSTLASLAGNAREVADVASSVDIVCSGDLVESDVASALVDKLVDVSTTVVFSTFALFNLIVDNSFCAGTGFSWGGGGAFGAVYADTESVLSSFVDAKRDVTALASSFDKLLGKPGVIGFATAIGTSAGFSFGGSFVGDVGWLPLSFFATGRSLRKLLKSIPA